MLWSTPFQTRWVGYYDAAAWPELTTAVTLAQICLLQAATVLAIVLALDNPALTGRLSASRMSTGLGAAIVAGLTVSFLCAAIAAAFFLTPWAYTLHWALWPNIPTAVCAAAVAAVAWRRAPTAGWDAFLAFPVSSVVAATAGVISSVLYQFARLPYTIGVWKPGFGYLGSLLVAIAVACLLARRVPLRIALSLLLALPLMILTPTSLGYHLLPVLYAATVAVWWLRRLWSLLVTKTA